MSYLRPCKNVLCDGLQNGMNTVIQSKVEDDSICEKYPWAVKLQCEICNATYYGCNQCHTSFSSINYISKSRLSRHNQMYHSNSITITTKNDCKRKFEQLSVAALPNQVIGTSFPQEMFNRQESFRYFWKNA